jgi:predicted acetyltransferase
LRKTNLLVIPKPALSARNLLAASSETADSSRDNLALRNDNPLGTFQTASTHGFRNGFYSSPTTTIVLQSVFAQALAYRDPVPTMTKSANQPSLHIEVVPAGKEQEPILANLLQLYAHDFSEFHNLDLGPDGRFGYPSLPLYWSAPGRHPFLVWVEGKLAGFALVKRGSEVSGDATVWDMAEFFVIRGFRRRGIGTQAAHEVWRRFPGLWEVRVMQSNTAAQDFWSRAISKFVGEAIHPVRVEKGSKDWILFSFEGSHASQYHQ